MTNKKQVFIVYLVINTLFVINILLITSNVTFLAVMAAVFIYIFSFLVLPYYLLLGVGVHCAAIIAIMALSVRAYIKHKNENDKLFLKISIPLSIINVTLNTLSINPGIAFLMSTK
ncbi:MAG: hypothetical protein FWD48_04425 [Oscillospiraceae bacterium]|nr:hypothetical protein [Oscillospiraceae bacterium]